MRKKKREWGGGGVSDPLYILEIALSDGPHKYKSVVRRILTGVTATECVSHYSVTKIEYVSHRYNRHSNYISWALSLRSFQRLKKRTTVNLWLSGLNNWWTALYNYFTLGILFKVYENAALKFCSQDWFWP